MKKTLASLILGAALSSSVLAASASSPGDGRPNMASVLSQIDDMEWSIKHSSVARTLASDDQARSLALVARARSEAADGHLRTALELARRAGRPLTAMSPEAMSGKHPDTRDHVTDLKTTMASILDVAEEIANEKSYPTRFVDEGREALKRSEDLAAAGNIDDANAIVAAAYGRLQFEIAGLRSGDQFVLDVPKGFTEREWSDAIRRYDERIQLSRYLVIEAQADGIDPAPLYKGIAAAETSLSQATQLALDDRWDQAYRSLDLSYLQLEESWKKVGVEW